MSAVDDFSRVISGIYAAVLAPERWDAALAETGLAFGAHTAALVAGENDSRMIRHAQIPAAAAQAYAAHYARIDHVLRAVESGPPGAVRTGAELMWPYPNCEFQVDWARPNQLRDGLFVRLTTGSPTISLAIGSAPQPDGIDTAEHLTLINQLVPHLQQALRLQHRLDELDHRSSDLAEAGESFGHGIVILADRRPVYLNAAAERILHSGDGLRIDHGRLRAESGYADTHLQGGITRAAALDSCDIWGGSFLCGRPSGRCPYIVHVLPIDPAAGPSGRVLVVVVDPARHAEPPAVLLQRLYGLTRSEAQVALRVIRGEGLGPIAEELSVTMATVKTHLQHVFEKTGVHRQSELVRLLITLDPLHRHGD